MRIIDSGPRGSGRTFNQLAALPNGSVFIVAHGPMAQHAKMILGRYFPGKQVKVVTVGAMLGRDWAGCLLTAVALDHSVVLDRGDEVAAYTLLLSRVRAVALTRRDADRLKDFLGRLPLAIVDEVADIWRTL